MQPDIGLVAARFLATGLLLVLAGVPFHLAINGKKVLAREVRGLIAVLAASALVASVWWALESVAAMASTSVLALDRATVLAVFEATPLGAVLAVRIAALACLIVAAMLAARTLPILFFALVALASSAWTGHSGAAQGGYGLFQRLLDVVHLGGASLWLGALLVFLASVLREDDGPSLVRSLSAFAVTGTIVVGALALTGGVNAVMIGSEGWSMASGWTQLLAVKVFLFLAMLGLAAQNRWRLTPALAQGVPGAERRLVRSLALEAACALAIVAIVAVLGLLDPAAS